MPVCRFVETAHNAYLLWRIIEPEKVLLEGTSLTPSEQDVYQKITHPHRKKEWLASRKGLKALLTELGYEYTGLHKDVWGKPYLAGSNVYISIAHCANFAFIAMDRTCQIGIDIQQPHEKLQKVKEKVFNKEEIEDAGNDLEKLCIYWCAKEAIYKAYGGKNLSFKQDVNIRKFAKSIQGSLQGKARSKLFTLHYSFFEGHVLACCRGT